MKKINLIIILSLLLFACKNDQNSKVDLEENRAKSYDQNDGYVTIRGEFIYDEDKNAGVLQTPSEIYGVIVDDNVKLLNEKVKPFKTDMYTTVPVTVRVKKIENSTDVNTWKYKVEIKEILKVEAPDTTKEDVIKIGN